MSSAQPSAPLINDYACADRGGFAGASHRAVGVEFADKHDIAGIHLDAYRVVEPDPESGKRHSAELNRFPLIVLGIGGTVGNDCLFSDENFRTIWLKAVELNYMLWLWTENSTEVRSTAVANA